GLGALGDERPKFLGGDDVRRDRLERDHAGKAGVRREGGGPAPPPRRAPAPGPKTRRPFPWPPQSGRSRAGERARSARVALREGARVRPVPASPAAGEERGSVALGERLGKSMEQRRSCHIRTVAPPTSPSH